MLRGRKMPGINPLYFLLIIPALLGWLAQWRVKKIYSQYLNVPNKKAIKGTDVAKAFLSYHNLNIPILQTKQYMVNYYNPQSKTLHFCDQVAENSSITSMGIVAHEVEHAAQDHQGCRFMVLRNKIARVLAIMGQFSPLFFIWGIFFRNIIFIYLGILLLFGMTIFAIVSLPVELNASKRAMSTLKEIGLADKEEIKKVSEVLRNAAFTYFAGAVQRIGTFLFIVMILFMFN